VHKADSLTAMSQLSRQCGILNILKPYRPPWPVTEQNMIQAQESEKALSHITKLANYACSRRMDSVHQGISWQLHMHIIPYQRLLHHVCVYVILPESNLT
jgi:hypothetical protein